MSGIIAVGNKHITSALNTEDKHHVRANPEKPSPVLCCCSPPSPLEWPVNISPSYPDPTDVQSVPLSLQITYTAYFPRAALAHQQHEALSLQTGSQKKPRVLSARVKLRQAPAGHEVTGICSKGYNTTWNPDSHRVTSVAKWC